MPPNFESDFFLENTSAARAEVCAPKPISIADILILADEPIPWLVDDLLIQGGCSLLAAKPKVGKTTFTRSLALAIARGEDFLGRKTKASTVLLMSLEDKLSEIGRHFRTMDAVASDKILVLATSPKTTNQLRQVIENHDAGLVVIDTMVLGINGLGDLNDYLQVSKSVSPYVKLARDTNTHIMFVHHMSKRERSGGDQILGSTALFGSVDSVLLLDRQKQRRVFSTIVRYGTDWPARTLNMSDDGRLFLGEEEANPIRQQILDCISRSSTPLTEKEIESMVYGRTSEKRKELRELVKNDEVVRQGAGSKNRPFQYSARH